MKSVETGAMPNLTADHDAEVRELRVAYAGWLPERIAALWNVAERVLCPRPDHARGLSRAGLETLLHLTQRLYGSSALFEFEAVSRAAQRLEDVLSALLDDQAACPGDDWPRILEMLEDLKRAPTEDALGEATGRRTALAIGPCSTRLFKSPDDPQRVLMVDDDQDTLNLISLHLRAAGLSVETALGGNEALETLRKRIPDVIVSDVRMGGMSGYELCRFVRGMGLTEVPFLFCSSLGASRHRVAGLRMGADDYVVKPFEPEELLLKLQRMAPRRPPPRTGRPDTAGPPVTHATKQILIVDDLKSAAALRPYLLRSGYHVQILGSGNEALDWMLSHTVDLVILNVVMPILSGLDVCRWIRSNPAMRRTPVVLLSARNRAQDVRAGDAAGCDLFLKKPVVGRRLVNLVDMFLSRDVPLLRRTAPIFATPAL